MVDTKDLKSFDASCVGSSPTPGTMKTEIEKLFYEVDKEALRKAILGIGGILVKKEFLQKRFVWSLPQLNGRHRWMRLRDEGDKVVLTYKIKTEGEHADEAEVVVSDFQSTKSILESVVCPPNSYQENFREIYMLNELEVAIDTWPFLDPVCEIEGESNEKIFELAKKLNLNIEKSMSSNVTTVYYQKYGKWIPEMLIEKQLQITFDSENPFL